ncbi:MAG: DUF4160 domain-containing protein [Longimicrobiales bacterium]|nr:DUF4160 domain-containing protein [Longimicrobiales bacterium]
MPTVHREAGFQFRIFPNDHRPPHVHAVKGDGSARILLVRGGEPFLAEVFDLADRDVVRAVKIVERVQEKLLSAWEALHGEGGSHG